MIYAVFQIYVKRLIGRHILSTEEYKVLKGKIGKTK